MIISYKYRAYPDPAVEDRLHHALDTCRWVYNKILETSQTAYKKGIKLSPSETQAMIVTWKREIPDLSTVYSKTLQMVNNTYWANVRALTEAKKRNRKTGKLRFKSAYRYRTLNYNQSGFKIDPVQQTVTLSKIGSFRFDMYRPYIGTIKGVLINWCDNGWYVIVQCQTKPVVAERHTERVVGIDIGLKSFAVDSDGCEIENPRFYQKSLPKIRKLHRRVSRKTRFSNNWKKAKSKLKTAYVKVTNQRCDFLHKLSRHYVDTYDVICVEDLDVKRLGEMGNNTGMHRSIHDVSWGRFFSFLSYKAESAGTKLIKVDPRNTTQMCSQCGTIVPKDLSVRIHHCDNCGLHADRDYNAAINIRRVGMEQPFMPVEVIPLHHIRVMQVLLMKQEAPCVSGA
jgi:putative transposase